MGDPGGTSILLRNFALSYNRHYHGNSVISLEPSPILLLSAKVSNPRRYETDALPLGHRATLHICIAIKILKTNTHNALGTSTSVITDPPFSLQNPLKKNKTTSVYRLVLLNKGLVAHQRIYLYRLSSYKPKQILPSIKICDIFH